MGASMKIQWVSAIASTMLLATPVSAQNAPDEKTVENHKLYQTSLECSSAALSLPFLSDSIPQAEKEALRAESEFWLVLAIEIAKTIGADVGKDSEATAYRMIAHVDLVGTDTVKSFYSALHGKCHAIYVELQKN